MWFINRSHLFAVSKLLALAEVETDQPTRRQWSLCIGHNSSKTNYQLLIELHLTIIDYE